MSEVGKRIRKYRLEHYMTMEDLAKAIDTVPQNIYKYEHGIITNIPLSKIRKMAGVFGVSELDIVGWETPEKFVSNDEREPIPESLGHISLEEEVLLNAYRLKPDVIKDAVWRLLDIPRPKE